MTSMIPVLLLIVAASASALSTGGAGAPASGLPALSPSTTKGGAAYCPNPVPGKIAGTYT